MGITSSNFNRIIDISLIPDNSNATVPSEKQKTRTITCPRHGQKPVIEINGEFWGDMTLPQFNITVKNLYLDLQKEQYAKIKVSCGYEGNTVPIEGTILSIYQESPGPDGTTIIQCQLGDLEDWLEATVNLNFEAGASLSDILDAIKTKLNASQVFMGIEAKKLSLQDPFMHNGSAREAISKLIKVFENSRLALFMRDTTLCAVCATKGDFIGTHVLQYISAPPQMNTGSEKGTYYTTITAPWMPKLRIGDLLEIPSKIYMYNYNLVGNGKTQKIQVTAIKFHFGTTGGTNSMTVQGFIA